MKTFTFDLEYVDPEAKGFPDTPHAYIGLKSWSGTPLSGLHVTPECRSANEIDYEVKRLKGELDRIARAAKRKFAASAKRPFVPRKRTSP